MLLRNAAEPVGEGGGPTRGAATPMPPAAPGNFEVPP